MKATFETAEFGVIEIDRETGKVYFRGRDWEVDLDVKTGRFIDLNGRQFQVHWPFRPFSSEKAILEVTSPRVIGSAKCERESTGNGSERSA